MSEDRYRIQLKDLINSAVETVISGTTGAAYQLEDSLNLRPEAFKKLLRAYEAACQSLIAMGAIGGFRAEPQHWTVWQDAIIRLSTHSLAGSRHEWARLHRYPATLLLYALGIGAVKANRLPFLGQLFAMPIPTGKGNVNEPAVQVLQPHALIIPRIDNTDGVLRILSALLDLKLGQLSRWISRQIEPQTRRIIPDPKEYPLRFDQFEILLALSHMHYYQPEPNWIFPGAFVLRHDNRQRIQTEIVQSLTYQQNNSRYVQSGIFGHSAHGCMAVLERFAKGVNEYLNPGSANPF